MNEGDFTEEELKQFFEDWVTKFSDSMEIHFEGGPMTANEEQHVFAAFSNGSLAVLRLLGYNAMATALAEVIEENQKEQVVQ